ncbi:hypothetical protein B566_EDAN005315 [Ephemera danica]|nr:hypothetical protein B566_EDAN005315 [Ephemera danica]
MKVTDNILIEKYTVYLIYYICILWTAITICCKMIFSYVFLTIMASELTTVFSYSVQENTKGYTIIGDHEYFISDSERFTWHNARDACIGRGMQLLTLTSAAKNDEIMAYFRANGMGLTSYWTGGYKTVDGSFAWSGTNEPFSYTWWATEQPDDVGAEAYVDFTAVNGWYDMPASLSIYPFRL